MCCCASARVPRVDRPLGEVERVVATSVEADDEAHRLLLVRTTPGHTRRVVLPELPAEEAERVLRDAGNGARRAPGPGPTEAGTWRVGRRRERVVGEGVVVGVDTSSSSSAAPVAERRHRRRPWEDGVGGRIIVRRVGGRPGGGALSVCFGSSDATVSLGLPVVASYPPRAAAEVKGRGRR